MHDWSFLNSSYKALGSWQSYQQTRLGQATLQCLYILISLGYRQDTLWIIFLGFQEFVNYVCSLYIMRSVFIKQCLCAILNKKKLKYFSNYTMNKHDLRMSGSSSSWLGYALQCLQILIWCWIKKNIKRERGRHCGLADRVCHGWGALQ